MIKQRSNNDLISIVIPVYGVEKYIGKCIKSVLVQTYRDIEIILVDDGSLDDCPRICDEYAKKDERIRVIHKKNGGLSDARNAGLEIAKGEYIAFIDGDDFIAPTFVRVLVEECINAGADISCVNYYKVFQDHNTLIRKPVDRCEFSNMEAMRDIFTADSICEVVTWNKLYKRSLFIENDITFPVGKLHEDVFTTYKLFYFANKVTYINQPLYFYVQRPDSIMGQGFSRKRFDIFEMFTDAGAFFEKRQVDFAPELQSARLLLVLGVYVDYLRSKKRDRLSGKRIRRELNKVGVSVFGNSLVTGRHKLLYILVTVSPGLFIMLRKIYDKKKGLGMKKVLG